MKKSSLTILFAAIALLFASCKTGDPKDANGDTPSTVVEKMYKAIQSNDFATAASYNKIPDTVKIDAKNCYTQFANNPSNKDEKIIITGEEWKSFLVERMQAQNSEFSLIKWTIVSEEISKTDPNSAKVKTKITIKKQNGQYDVDCSFPMKRENNVWKIIG